MDDVNSKTLFSENSDDAYKRYKEIDEGDQKSNLKIHRFLTIKKGSERE